ncbi:MAG: molybdopterin cofactor-binding domain-containing protein [Syntrophaceticus schinkii]
MTRVTDFLAVGDVGRVLNRGIVEGQFQGAVQMGIGYALCEEVKIDDQGKPVNNSFKKYHMVNAPDMPDVKVLLIEHEGDDGPLVQKVSEKYRLFPLLLQLLMLSIMLWVPLSEMPLTEKILDAPGTGSWRISGEQDASGMMLGTLDYVLRTVFCI